MPIYGINKLDRRILKLRASFAKTIPRRIGQDAENHFRDSFKYGGFTDRTLVKWPPRKAAPTNKRGKVVKHTVLFQTGILRNSVRLVRADWNDIQVIAGGSHAPYARIHNEGGTISKSANVRAHGRREHKARMKNGKVVQRKAATVAPYTRTMNTVIPKRQFMGESQVLRGIMRQTIERTIVETFYK